MSKFDKDMQYSIFYPTPLDEIEDKFNDNIDVCVQLNDEIYTFTVVTLKNLNESIWLDKKGFVVPSMSPILIVKELRHEIIESLIDELYKDKELLKLYGKDLNN